MREKDEREEEPLGAESEELIRAHAELKKMVPTGEDLLYWNHTSGQRPLTRDERKQRREARRVNADEARPIWHDTDADPGSDVIEAPTEARLDANPPAREHVAFGDPSGLWLRMRRAKVAVGAAVVTILLGAVIAYFAPGARLPVTTAPTAAPVEEAERRAAPAPAPALWTAPATDTALPASTAAKPSALPERVPNVLPRRPVQAPRGARPPTVPVAPPSAAPPADGDSVANPDYDLLVPELRQP